MEKGNKLLDNVSRAIKNRTPIDKYISKLRNSGQLNTLLKVNKISLTLLMYYVRENDFKTVKELLSGKNPASTTIINAEGLNALALAIINACENPNYELAIIDELLKHELAQQLKITVKGMNLLYIATFHKRLDLIKKLFHTGEIDSLLANLHDSPLNFSPLHLAAEQNHIEIVEELLKYQPEKQVLVKNKEGRLPIHEALISGYFEIVKKLLLHKPIQQISSKDNRGVSIFDFSVAGKDIDMIGWLIENYPQILEQRSTDGFTPLHTVCKQLDKDLIRLLLKRGPPKQVTTPEDMQIIPIHLYLLHSSFSIDANHTSFNHEIFEELLQKYPLEQIKQTNSSGMNLIHLACQFNAISALKIILEILFKQEKDIELEKIFLQKGIGGFIPLMLLLTSKIPPNIQLELITNFIKLGSIKQLKIQNDDHHTSLLLAMKDSNPEIIQSLIQFDSKEQLEICFTVNSAIQPAIGYKVSNNSKTVQTNPVQVESEQLISSKLKDNSTKNTNTSLYPIEVAIFHNRLELVKILMQHQTTSQLIAMNNLHGSLLHFAISFKLNDIVKFLLKTDLCKNLIDLHEPTYGSTPLHTAVSHNNNLAVEMLIEHGAKLDLTDKKGWTALHIACVRGNVSTLQLLLKKGANPHILLENNGSALHIAARYDNLEILKILINHFSEIDVSYKSGITPLFQAVFSKNIRTTEFLLEKGANPNKEIATEKYCITPLLLAAETLDFTLIELLLKHKADPYKKIWMDNYKDLNIISLIEMRFSKHPEIYKKFKKILPSIKEDNEKSNNNTSPNTLEKVTELSIFKSRNYLTLLGYSEKKIKAFEQERKEKKKFLIQKLTSSNPEFLSKSEKQKITWLEGKISSQDNFIMETSSPGNETVYYYFDELNLADQGCDTSILSNRRFKFDAYHFKALTKDKGIYQDTIKLFDKSAPQSVTYTHEFKINNLDRILFFPLLDDNEKITLWIGIKYLPGGLHTKGSINSFFQSLKHNNNNCLEVKWPKKENLKITLS